MRGRPKPWSRDIVALLGDLDVGGVPRTYAQLLGRVVERGGRATLVAPLGPCAELAAKRGVTVVPVDWEDRPREAVATAVAECGKAEAAVAAWDPRLVRAIPAVAATGTPLVVGLHSQPAMNAVWFGEENQTSLGVLQALLRSGRAVLATRGPGHRREAMRDLGVPEQAVAEVPVGIDADEFAFRPDDGDSNLVLALARLSPEKLSVVRVAARLVAARPGTRLAVVGDGPSRGDAVDILTSHLPDDAWTLEGATGLPLERMARAGVVVAQGRTVLEAAALGRPAVVTRSRGLESGGAVVTSRSYDETALDALARPAVEVDAAQLWPQIDALDGAELQRIRRCVERRNSASSEDAALGEAIRRARPAPDPVLAAATEAWLAADEERVRAKGLADVLWSRLELAERDAEAAAAASD